MARKVLVRLVDDLRFAQRGVATVTFSLVGDVLIDLNRRTQQVADGFAYYHCRPAIGGR